MRNRTGLGTVLSTLGKSTLAIAACLAVAVPVATGTADAAVFNTADNGFYQPEERVSCSYTFQKNELAVVNFAPKWGNKAANVKAMVKDIKAAHKKGTKIILFPEMTTTGYSTADDPSSKDYKMPVRLAENLKGPTQRKIAKLADKFNMWIIYGGTQKVHTKNGNVSKKRAYNSAFACSPKGEVTAYQKLTPVEGSWCKKGKTPVLLDAGKYGKIGISICYDTYSVPELGRYYAARGANILVNLTATSKNYETKGKDKGWQWYYKNRIETTVSREGYTVLSANLVGKDGPKDSWGNRPYLFPGGSVICGPIDGEDGPVDRTDYVVYYAGVSSSQLGVETNSADITTGKKGIQYNCLKTVCSTGETCQSIYFNPALYARLYKRLAKESKTSSLSYSYNSTKGPKAAVANMVGTWGDPEATAKIMDEYVAQAAEKGVDILVFPEAVLSGYTYVQPDDGEDCMQVKTAQSKDGAIAKHFAALAKANNMYIVYGAPEMPEGGPIVEDGVKKVYDSAFICMPDGTVTTYQKIHLMDNEAKWAVTGSTPCMFTIPWDEKHGWIGDDKNAGNDIKAGVVVCQDGSFYPEIARYYAAEGCTLLIQPAATTGNPWYRVNRMSSYTDRDGLGVISCNLLGYDGLTDSAGNPVDANGDGKIDDLDGCTFKSTSLIVTRNHLTDDYVDWNRKTGSSVDLNGTGSESKGFAKRGSSPAGLEVAKMNLNGCGFGILDFNPRIISKLYDNLAQRYTSGYQSIFKASCQLTEPRTVKLS